MAGSRFLVSIVIPTHNRARYAIPCLKSLLDIDSDQIQIVVHDTSNDNRHLSDWVASQSDPRLAYIHCSTRLSMTENHERALEMANGEYLCLIGDDDSVSKEIVKIAEYAARKSIDVVTPTVRATYSWPDFKTWFYRGAHAGKVYLDRFSGKMSEKNARDALQKALGDAAQGTDELPKLYHGLVSKRLLDRIREVHGRVFFGASPDVSSAIAIALSVKTYHVVDFPFTLPGASGGSNTGRSAVRKHRGELSSDPHTTPFRELKWPACIPQFFSVETVWAQAAIETLEGAGHGGLIQRYNFTRLYALCLFSHLRYRKQIFAAWNESRSVVERGISIRELLYELLVVLRSRIGQKLRRLMRPIPSNGREVVGIAPDVYSARCMLDQRISGAWRFPD